MLLGRIDEDTTANIGLISGGKATNIVPEEALIEGEARSMDEEKVLMQMKHMREVCENAAFKYGAWAKVTIEKSHDGIDVPLDSTAGSNGHCRLAASSARKYPLSKAAAGATLIL